MNKLGKIAIGLVVGGVVANRTWIAISPITMGKALEYMRIAENIKDRELVKRACEKDLMYSDLTNEEWIELRDLLDTMVKNYKKAYRLISITKFKRKAESIVEMATNRADMKSAIGMVEEKIEEINEFLKENREQQQ